MCEVSIEKGKGPKRLYIKQNKKKIIGELLQGSVREAKFEKMCYVLCSILL